MSALAAAGCVAAEEEAVELLAAAAAGDRSSLDALLARRVAGEPLAWVVGGADFAGHRVRVDPGVYIPRQQTALLVAAAVEVLPDAGAAVDLCTGSGAVALAMALARPGVRVAATDVDRLACECARANAAGRFEVHEGDLDAGLPAAFDGSTDVVTAVAPYVPTAMMDFLPRDVREHEPRRALEGGADGMVVIARVVAAAARLLRTGGHLVVEVGADQDRYLAPLLDSAGFGPGTPFRDGDGDLRAVRASLLPPGGWRRPQW